MKYVVPCDCPEPVHVPRQVLHLSPKGAQLTVALACANHPLPDRIS